MTSRAPAGRTARALALSAAAALVLTACGGADDGGSAGAAPSAAEQGSAPTRWESDLLLVRDDISRPVDPAPVLIGETVVVGTTPAEVTNLSSDGVAAVDATSGETLWEQDLPLPGPDMRARWESVQRGVAGGEPVVVVSYELSWAASGLRDAGRSRQATAFDVATGDVLWSVEAPGALFDDVIRDAEDGVLHPEDELPLQEVAVFTGTDGATGLDMATGRQLWTYDGPAQVRWASGDVLVGTHLTDSIFPSTSLVGIDRATGAVAWTSTDPAGTTSSSAFTWDPRDIRGGAILAHLIVDPSNVADSYYQVAIVDAVTGAFVVPPRDVAYGLVDGLLAPDGRSGYVLDHRNNLTAAVAGWTIAIPERVEPELVGFDEAGNLLLESAGIVTLAPDTGEQVGAVQTRDDLPRLPGGRDRVGATDSWAVRVDTTAWRLEGERFSS